MSNPEIELLASQIKLASPNSEWDAAGVDRANELAQMFARAGVLDFTKLSVKRGAFDIDSALVTNPDRYSVQLEYSGRDGERVTRYVYDAARNEKIAFQSSMLPGGGGVPGYSEFGGPFGVQYGLCFDYLGAPVGFLGEQNHGYSERPIFKDAANNGEAGYLVAWSSAGHGHVGYYLRPGINGFAVVPLWGSSSDARAIREMLTTIASVVVSVFLPAAGVAVASNVGAAVIGTQLATAYPMLATIVGNTLISTALSGGNLERAIQNAVVSYAAGVAGNFAGSAVYGSTNSALVARVASSVVAASVRGGDINQAALQALIVGGAASIPTGPGTVSDPYAPSPFDDGGDYWSGPETGPLPSDPGGDWWLDPAYFPIDPLPPADPGDEWWVGPTTGPLPADPGGEWWLDPAYFPVNPLQQPTPVGTPAQPWPGSPVATPAPATIPPTANTPAPAPWWVTQTPRQILGEVTNAAMQALSLVSAWQKLRLPINNQAQTVVGTRVQTVTSDGFVRTQNGNSISNAKPPVGEPRATADGYVIMNNGDGTFTRVSPSGEIKTIPYTTQAPTNSLSSVFSSSNQATLFAVAAGVGVLVFALKGKK